MDKQVSAEAAAELAGGWACVHRGHGIIGSTVQETTSTFLPRPTPLLKKEGHTLFSALRQDVLDPSCLHRTRMGPRLAANDNPRNPPKIKLTQVLEQRLDRQESNCNIDIS